MKTFRVAAVTMNARLGDVGGNLEKMAGWTGRAAAEGAQVVLFPELSVNGHCDPETERNAELVPHGPSVQAMCRLASQHGLFLCAGLSERDGDKVLNTQVMVGPAGFVGGQRKIHLSRDEVLYFQPGSECVVMDLGFCRVGISICYDGWSPEVPRMLALGGAEVLLAPHASRMRMWQDTAESERAAAQHAAGFFHKVFPARAFENGCFVVVVNQAGKAGTVARYAPDDPNQPHHAGACMVFDPAGDVVAELGCDAVREEMLVADLDAGRLEAARAYANWTLRTRRPEVYGRLVE